MPNMTKESIKSVEAADKIIGYHLYAAMGVALIPVPLVDFAALTCIQINMLRKIAQLYKVPFSKATGKNILLSLFGGIFPAAHARPFAHSIAKFIPGAGHVLGVAAMPILAGSTTYAIGKLVSHHCAWGGSLDNFDPEKAKDDYKKMVEQGKKAAADRNKKI